MHIAHVIESYAGGAMAVVNQLCNQLVADGHTVTLLYGIRSETPENWKELLDFRVATIRIESFTREIRPRQDFKALVQLRRVLKQLSPDVIHLHSSKAGALGRAAAASLGWAERVMYTPHGFAFKMPSTKKSKVYWALEKVCGYFGGTIVGCSQDESNAAAEIVPVSRIRTLANAIDTEALAPLKAIVDARRATDSLSHVNVVMMGRLCEMKSPEFFAETKQALESAREANPGLYPHVTFSWVGGGTYKGYESGESFSVTGWLSHEDAVKKLANEADIFFLSSHYEGLPLVLLEAQALGIPVVSRRISGVRGFLAENTTALLVDSPSEAASAILHLACQSGERKAIGEAGYRRTSARFGIKEWAETAHRLYADTALRGIRGGKLFNTVIRTADVCLATLAGIVALPVFLALLAAIWAEDGKSPLFKQVRLGKDGAKFWCYKLRTMRPDAETVMEKWKSENSAEWHSYRAGGFKLQSDPRVTRTGKVLRRYSLDELPQLWNVIIGDMSLVGPRPLLERELNEYGVKAYESYKQVKPGLTGLWQVSGRSALAFQDRVGLDSEQLKGRSLRQYLELLVKTPHVVMHRTGAY